MIDFSCYCSKCKAAVTQTYRATQEFSFVSSSNGQSEESLDFQIDQCFIKKKMASHFCQFNPESMMELPQLVFRATAKES